MSEPTTERLARDLESAELPSGMVAAARAGFYDTFRSTDPSPLLRLIEDLRHYGHHGLADEVADGKYEATDDEAREWLKTPNGQAHRDKLRVALLAADDVDVTHLLRDLQMAPVPNANVNRNRPPWRPSWRRSE